MSRWRLWPQFRLILPLAVRPKRFFAPLFVLSLGIFRYPCQARGAESRGPPRIRAGLYSDGACRRQAGESKRNPLCPLCRKRGSGARGLAATALAVPAAPAMPEAAAHAVRETAAAMAEACAVI